MKAPSTNIRSEGSNEFGKTCVLVIRFRRLTLRSATGTAQRAIPTTAWNLELL